MEPEIEVLQLLEVLDPGQTEKHDDLLLLLFDQKQFAPQLQTGNGCDLEDGQLFFMLLQKGEISDRVGSDETNAGGGVISDIERRSDFTKSRTDTKDLSST